MTKLLNANFRRLWRSKTFWIGLAVACAHHLLGVLNNFHYKDIFTDQVIKADHTLEPDTLILSLIVAVITAFFIGREYGDKTIRNKIVTGHARSKIYLANLIVCSAAAAILFFVPMLVMGLAVGAPLMGGFELPAKAFILPVLCDLLALLAFTALFVLIAMSVQNRTACAVIVLLLAFVRAWIPTPLRETLESPQYVTEVVFSEELDDFVETGRMMENQAYVGGAARTVLEFAYDFLPACQLEQTSAYNETRDMIHLPVYSVAFILVTTLGGAWVFEKKELK